MPPIALLLDSASQSSAGEVAELLDSLIVELVGQPDHEQKCALLNELAVAGTCNWRLQQVFFANRTQLRVASFNARAPTVTGLPAMLIQELFALLVERQEQQEELALGSLEYVSSALSVLFRMCFAGQLMPERLRFFLEASLEEFVYILTSPVSKPKHYCQHEYQTTATLVVDEILDNQVALLLELEALQQEANVVDPAYFGHSTTKHFPQLVHRSPTFATWVGKLFKRIARSVSRAETEMRTLQMGSCWSLALWKNVKLLDQIWNANMHVLPLILEAHVDYLKYVQLAMRFLLGGVERYPLLTHSLGVFLCVSDSLYLRNPRHIETLRNSSIVHISETATRLQRFLDALPDTRTQ